MISPRDKEEVRRSAGMKRLEGRQKLIFANRGISLNSFQESTFDEHQLRSYIDSFRRPNTRRCYDALKKLNSIFFECRDESRRQKWIEEIFRLDNNCTTTIHSLVGVFTNFNMANNRTQAEAGFCLANLCCVKTARCQSFLIKFATPYFVTFLADGPETTRVSLAIASLEGLGNLACGINDKTTCGHLISQNVMESVATMIIHTNNQIREAGYFALESILIASLKYGKETLAVAVKNLHRYRSEFVSELYRTLRQFTNDNSPGTISSIFSHCAYCIFLLSTLEKEAFPNPTTDQITIILQSIEHAKTGPTVNLAVIFPLWRAIGSVLGRQPGNDIDILSTDSNLVSHLITIASTLLRSPYVPLRKETLWVLVNFFSSRICCSCVFQHMPLHLVADLFHSMIKTGKTTLCSHIKRLCLRVFLNVRENCSLDNMDWLNEAYMECSKMATEDVLAGDEGLRALMRLSE